LPADIFFASGDCDIDVVSPSHENRIEVDLLSILALAFCWRYLSEGSMIIRRNTIFQRISP